MFQHNLLLLYRNFKRFKSTFIINLVGLSTGLTCVLLIYLWVKDERSIDRFNEKDERLFQVMQNLHKDDGTETIDATSGLLANALAEEIPEVEYAVSVIPSYYNSSKGIVIAGNTRIKVKGQYASKDYFSVFSYKLIKGDPEQVLTAKDGLVISKDLALKLFKTVENAMGKPIDWQGLTNASYFVSGIFQSPPPNATIQFDVLFNFDVFVKGHEYVNQWGNSDPFTYVVLKPGASADGFNSKIKGFMKSKVNDSGATLFAQRYSNRYLHGRYENGVPSGGRIEYVNLFSAIAFFIVMIACINFMNLSTAKASRRIKEVGIKKAMGASRITLVSQYMGESILISFLSLAVALLMTDLLLPPFNLVTDKLLVLNFDINLISVLVISTLVTGIISGSYPALYLSGFNPSTVLKGKLQTTLGEVLARKGLVIFQFVVSVILIICVWVVYEQMQFVQVKKLGYDRDHVVYFDTEKVSDAYMTELKAIPGVLNAARFYHDLTGGHGGTGDIQWEGKNPDNNTDFSNLEVGYGLIETMGMQLAEGYSFSEKISWEDQIIFNEAAIESMGLKNPIGQTITIWGMKRKIVGVVKNFHFESLYEKVKPCFLFLIPMITDTPSKIMVKIEKGSEQKTLAELAAFYSQHNQGLPFDYQFMDEAYERLYASEKRVGVLSRCFALLAVLISCLGLFSLAAFTAERRLKEIGIRKVLGSSEIGIVYLLSEDITKIVLVAIATAIPFSYFIMQQWLNSFAFKIPLQWGYFTGAGVLALVIAWLTIGTQAIRAARVNPTQCLKDE
jgi:ABC-type antimicrobial peptide transport system permease subunit